MILMEIFFLIMLFFMGTVFGSFFTLAVYRIPLNLDITHERSFCPNCNHRLEFIDLIPVFSYLSLGGKCRYCGKPVRIRYLLLEVLSGLVFVTAYFSLRLNFPFFEQHSIALMIAFVMFYITNAIILGIDKEYVKIDKRVLLFGVITQSIYMLYLFTVEGKSLILYSICLIVMLALFVLETIVLKRKKKIITDNVNSEEKIKPYPENSRILYLLSILELLVYEISFIKNWKIILGMLILTEIIFVVYKVMIRFINKNKMKNEDDIEATVRCKR